MNFPVEPGEFSTFLRLLGPFEDAPKVAVAVSGGCDSLCLVLLLQEWILGQKGQLWACIVDHRLRLESTKDVEKTAALLSTLCVPFAILPWEGPKPRTGIQSKAREMRYRLLLSWCRERAVRHLFLAHHANDQLETFFMRKMRGSRARGLAGMSACVEQGGVRLLRPLLSIPRSRLQATLLEKKIPWIEDPSNQDPRFTRTQIRKQCQRLSQKERQRQERQIKDYAFLRRQEEEKTKSLLGESCQFFPGGYAFLNTLPFGKAPPVHQRLGLRRILKTIRGKEKFLKERQIDAFLEALHTRSPSYGRTLNGCFFKEEKGKVLVCREIGTLDETLSLHPQHPLTFLWDHRFLVTLSAPPPLPLLTLRALGEEGISFLKKHSPHLLKSTSIPRAALLSLPSLWKSPYLIELPHLNMKGEALSPSFQDSSKIDTIIKKMLPVGGSGMDFFSSFLA